MLLSTDLHMKFGASFCALIRDIVKMKQKCCDVSGWVMFATRCEPAYVCAHVYSGVDGHKCDDWQRDDSHELIDEQWHLGGI